MSNDLDIQLEGHIHFGLTPNTLTEFSLEISQLTLNTQLQTATLPKTYGRAREEQRKSGMTDSVTINFLSRANLTSFRKLVWDAQRDDDAHETDRRPGELYFRGRYHPGPVDPDTNPEYGGWVLCSDLDTGHAVGEIRQQQKTWPARDIVELSAPQS